MSAPYLTMFLLVNAAYVVGTYIDYVIEDIFGELIC